MILAQMNPAIGAHKTTVQAARRLAGRANESLLVLTQFPVAKRANPKIVST